MSTMNAGRLSGLDNFWLQIENPRRLMTVSSLWTFDDQLNSQQVYNALDLLCARYPRFGLVPAHGSFWQTPAWCRPIGWTPTMNVEQHRLCAPTREALEEYIADQMSRPFIYTRPLWELHAISGLENGRCAMFWKAHHCMADGAAFVGSLISTTLEDTKKMEPVGDTKRKRRQRLKQQDQQQQYQEKRSECVPPVPDQLWQHLPPPLRLTLTWSYRIFHNLWLVFILLLHDTWLCIYALLALVCPEPKRDLWYSGLQDHRKQVAWSGAIRLKDVKTVRHAWGGTVNDIMTLVLVRCIKGALAERGQCHDKYLRFLVPISQRSSEPEQGSSFGNVVSGTWGTFSMQDMDTQSLLHQIRTEMQAIKMSRVPRLMYEFGTRFLLAYAPCLLPLGVIERMANVPHAVFTNVPGPQEAILWGGQVIRDYSILPPQSGKGCLAIGLISYCGDLRISIMADATPPGVARGVCDRFVPEFEFLLREAGMALTRRRVAS